MIRRTLFAAALAVASLSTVAANAASARCPDEDMPPAMRTAYVRGAQEALRDHGFRPGVADGVMGPNTRSAVRAYQRAAHLPVDGCVTNDLLNHMNFATPKVYGPGRRG